MGEDKKRKRRGEGDESETRRRGEGNRKLPELQQAFSIL